MTDAPVKLDRRDVIKASAVAATAAGWERSIWAIHLQYCSNQQCAPESTLYFLLNPRLTAL